MSIVPFEVMVCGEFIILQKEVNALFICKPQKKQGFKDLEQ